MLLLTILTGGSIYATGALQKTKTVENIDIFHNGACVPSGTKQGVHSMA